MMLIGLIFDEMDSVSDVDIWRIPNAQSWTSLSTTTPSGTGKSLAIDNGGGYLQLGCSSQAGKTLNFLIGYYYGLGTYGAIFSIHSSVLPSRAQQICLYVNSSGYLEARRGSTIIATGTTQLAPDTFNTLQITSLVANTGGVFVVYINGNPTPDINFSGDTQNQASNEITMMCFGHDGVQNTTTLQRLHRFVCFDTTGTDNNGLVPSDLTYGILHPSADGATIWSPSTGANVYSLIDEPIGTPNDADYGKTSTLNAKNRGVLGSPPSNVGTVAAVQVLTRLNKPNVGTIAVKAGTLAGASEAQSAARYLPQGASNYADIFEYKTGTTKYAAADITGGTLEVTAEVTAVG